MLTPRRHRTPVQQPLRDPELMLIADPACIRIHRRGRRYSLRQLAEMCGRNSVGARMCSYQAISDWESGKTKTIPEETAIRLTQILDLPMAGVFRPTEVFVAPNMSTTPRSDHQTVR